jgi:hypothetical protein
VLLLNRNLLGAGLWLALCISSAPVSNAARTVTSNERGLYYAIPHQCNGDYNCTNWAGIGAYLGQFNYQYYFDRMDPSALKLVHGRFQHFAAFDDTTEALFPYSQLVQYDASEVAAGRSSLFVTATYQGVKRPVIWTWYGSTDPFYVNNLGRAVDLKDERFVQFWVNQYIRPWMQKINRTNLVILLDNCTFDYNLYGVKDNSGNFIPDITWDSPYAQNQTEFLHSIDGFFVRVRQIDPSIKMVCNTDASSSPAEFVSAYQNSDGIGVESMEYFYQGGNDWWRSKLYNQYVNASWVGNAGKIGIMVWQIPKDAGTEVALRRSYLHYLMVRGDNFFYAPQLGHIEVAPELYAVMKDALGLPVGATVVAQEPGRPQGYVLYSRQTSGGIAYLNWTGVPKTITLPSGHQYFNSVGQSVTQITIGDMAADYVLFADSTAAQSTAAVPPTNVSVSPASGSGTAQIFTAIYDDADGATDIASSRLLIGGTLSGANSCLIEFNRAANTLRLMNDAGNTWLGPIIAGSGSLSNRQCSLAGAGSGGSMSFNTLTVKYAIAFKPAFSGAYKVNVLAIDIGGRSSPWESKGTWVVNALIGSSPTVKSLFPLTGEAGSATFTASFGHSGGASQHYLGYILLLPTPNMVNYTATGSCLIEYNRISNGVRLINDAGTGWLGTEAGIPISPSASVLENARCSVNVAQVVATVDGMTMTVSAPVVMKNSFKGVLATFLQSLDVNGVWTGMTQFGNWVSPGANTPEGPLVAGLSPTSGAGSSTVMKVSVSHSGGALTQLQMIHVLINSFIVEGTSCHIVYAPSVNLMNVINDTGTSMSGTWVAPGAGVVGNSRCSVSGTGMTRTIADQGRTVSVTIPVSFNTSIFTGAKYIYVNAFDNNGLLSHWVQRATWTIQ